MDEIARDAISSEQSEEDELVRPPATSPESEHRERILETWLSGRKYLTANEAGRNCPRGFESLRLRKTKAAARQSFAFGAEGFEGERGLRDQQVVSRERGQAE